MAKSAKKKASNVVVWIILVLLMIGLAGFGATNFGGSVRAIGSVGDTEITTSRYARELEQELRSLSAQTGQNITLSQAQAFGIDRAVLQRLLGAAALENEVERLGLSVGDAEVQQQVVSVPAFQGIDGTFDREAYEFALDRSGLNPAGFEQSIRMDLARGLLRASVTSGVAAPDTFIGTLTDYVGERRSFVWTKLDRDALETPVPEPTEEDLRSYYDENPEQFALPEARDITYVWLSPDQLVDQIEVDDAALRELYEDRAEEYDQPERRLVERIVFGTQDEAEAAAAAIEDGSKSFEDLVADRGLDLADVDLGDVSRDDLGPAADAVFALDAPGIAGPTDSDLGPALYRVNAILPAQKTSFDEARDKLKSEFTMDRARRIIADRIDAIEDLLAGGATLEEVADETDMMLGQVEWTPDMSADLTGYADFKTAAAAATTEDFPEVIQLEDGGIFALRLNEVIPARTEPFADAKVRVIEAWEAAQIRDALTAQAEDIAAQLEDGATLDDLGLPATEETELTRDAFIEQATPEFLARIFTLEPGDAAVVQAPESVLIGQLSDILPADTKGPDSAQMQAQIDEALRQGIADDLLGAFTSAMEAKAGISLNQTAINAVHAQFP